MATEKRLIDANALLEKIQYRLPIVGTICEVLSDIVGMTRRHIEEAPTVDAVEVVHGRWEDVSLRFTQVKEKCSVCGGIVYAHAFNYCPNCGADMRGGEDA